MKVGLADLESALQISGNLVPETRVGVTAKLENGVITAAELNDARLSLLETEWELTQVKYAQIVAAAQTRFAAGL